MDEQADNYELGVARRFGLSAIEHIGMASRGSDRRIAHDFHIARAASFARLAARAALKAVPSLRED